MAGNTPNYKSMLLERARIRSKEYGNNLVSTYDTFVGSSTNTALHHQQQQQQPSINDLFIKQQQTRFTRLSYVEASQMASKKFSEGCLDANQCAILLNTAQKQEKRREIVMKKLEERKAQQHHLHQLSTQERPSPSPSKPFVKPTPTTPLRIQKEPAIVASSSPMMQIMQSSRAKDTPPGELPQAIQCALSQTSSARSRLSSLC